MCNSKTIIADMCQHGVAVEGLSVVTVSLSNAIQCYILTIKIFTEDEGKCKRALILLGPQTALLLMGFFLIKQA